MQSEQLSLQKKKDDILGQMDECGERAEYHNLVDILFVIDATASMGWCMSEMKKTVCKIMKKFSDKQYDIKFAMSLYRDHQPQDFTYVEKHFDLRNLDQTIKVIDKECQVGGGGDIPEAVFDGLVGGLKKTSWRIGKDGKTMSKRFLFHGCDAPPHGQQYGRTSSSQQWTEKGCPCGLKKEDVKKLLDEYNVAYSLIKCGDQVETMAKIFKQCFSDKFRRELQIKKSKVSKLEKTVEYMEDIQFEMYGSCRSSSDQERLELEEPRELKEDYMDFSAFEKSVPNKNKKNNIKIRRKSKQKRQKSVSQSSNSSGRGSVRSMASLVCSDIQDGIQIKRKNSKEQKQP